MGDPEEEKEGETLFQQDLRERELCIETKKRVEGRVSKRSLGAVDPSSP